MPTYAPASSGKEFEKPTPDVPLQAVLVEVRDLGINKKFNKFQNKMEDVPEVQFKYEFAERDKEGFRKSIIERFRFSLHEKAKLRARAKSLLGGKEPPKNFDFDNLIGTNIQLVTELVQSHKDPAKYYSNITAVLKLTPGMKPLSVKDDKAPVTTAARPVTEADPINNDDIPF